MDAATPLTLNYTPGRDLMTIEYAQPSTHQPKTDIYPLFSSLKLLDNKSKGLRVSDAFFQKKLPDGRANETVATIDEWSDWWKSRNNRWSTSVCYEL